VVFLGKKTAVMISILVVVLIVLMAGVSFGKDILLKTNNPSFEKDPAFYKSLGNEMASEGKPAAAIAAYEKSLTLADDDNVRSNLAVLYYQEGSYNDAIRQLRALLAIDSNNPGYHYDLAVNLVDKFRNTDEKSVADLEEALREYESAEAISPGFSNAGNNIAALRRVLGKDAQ
jgi:tetratricopeptide (TPR) repeat protein